MPQFEVTRRDGQTAVERVRARTAEAAVQAVINSDAADLSLHSPDSEGWRDVEVEGKVVARVREHAARMRFRRD